jgi:hypothetical protein|nr:MAG TPA: hypothetical protein [Caudoviricetes sp.]
MSDTARIDTFIATLREASKTEPPYNYDHGSPTDKLITLTGNVNDLCWELAAATKLTAPSYKIIAADGIKHNATNIIAICIAELKNLGHTTEGAIELIATDSALWFWSLDQHPLNKLDRNINPADRIQSLNVAAGQVTEWWPTKISPLTNIDRNDEIERTFTNLAYEAACATIAHNHTTETETHND